MATNAAGEAVRQGKEILCADLAIATASAVLATPFKLIDSVQVTRHTPTAPGLTSSVFTWEFTGGVLTIYAWRPTSATDPTLIAGNAASVASVLVVGRRR